MYRSVSIILNKGVKTLLQPKGKFCFYLLIIFNKDEMIIIINEGVSTNMVDNQNLKPKCKIWIEYNDKIVFGSGRLSLFQEINKCGSINKAAENLGMSYRAAWGKINASEKQLDTELLNKQAGGHHSGSDLKPEAKKLVNAYINYKNEAIQAVDQLFQKHFEDIDI